MIEAVTTDEPVPPLLVRVMGVTVAVECPDEETRARLARQWSRAVVPEQGDAPVASVAAGRSTPEEQDAADYTLTTQVTMAALRATRGRRLNFHAGGLADTQGRVIALIAPSGTGKTTATRLLAQRLGYLSDETVSLDPDGRVHPHPKPLSVLPTDPAGHKRQLSPDELGLLPTTEVGRLARLLVLRRGVPEPRGLVRLEPVEGILEVVEQSSSLAYLPDPLSTLVGLIAGSGGVWALEYDEFEEHVEQVLEFLAADPPPQDVPVPVSHPGREDTHVPPGQVARGPWREAVELDDDVVVLLEGRAIHLDNLMATLWLELETPRTVEDLVAAAQQHLGEHPEADARVRHALEVLAQEALVVSAPLA